MGLMCQILGGNKVNRQVLGFSTAQGLTSERGCEAGRWLLGMTRLREEQGWAEDKITGREVVRHGEAAVVEGACKVLGLCRK